MWVTELKLSIHDIFTVKENDYYLPCNVALKMHNCCFISICPNSVLQKLKKVETHPILAKTNLRRIVQNMLAWPKRLILHINGQTFHKQKNETIIEKYDMKIETINNLKNQNG